jgi:hypothetical protein
MCSIILKKAGKVKQQLLSWIDHHAKTGFQKQEYIPYDVVN